MRSFTKTLMLAMAMLLSWAANAQSVTFQDYDFSTGVDATQWITLSSSATTFTGPTSGSGDGYTPGLQQIGFTFQFCGVDYTQFSANSDGNLRLGSTVTGTGSYSSPFSSSNAATNAPKINGMGRDGRMYDASHNPVGTGAYISHEVVGTAPNRILVVEFANASYSSTYTLTHFQVQLYETTNAVKIVYGAPPTGTVCTTGYQVGMSTNASNVVTINTTNHTISYGATTTLNTSSSASSYPEEGRWYEFAIPQDACERPVMASNDVQAYEVTLSWYGAANASSWNVYLGTDTVLGVTDTFYTFTQLTPNTVYSFGVQADCTVDSLSRWSTGSLRTACVPIDQIPWSEDFESYATGASDEFIPCWNRLGSTAQRPYVYSGNAHSGGKCLCYFASTGATDHCISILPPIDGDVLDLSTMQVSFYARQWDASYNCDVTVGVMTNPNDLSTFVPVAAVHPAGTTYELFEVPLASYTGTGTYVALSITRHAGYTSSIYMGIDDVTLEEAPDCLRPTNLAVDTAAVDEITLAWNEIGSATAWNIAYSTEPIGDFDTATVVSVTDNPTTITGLDPLTRYYFYVQSDCGGSVSAWSNEAIGTTGFSCDILGDGDGTYAALQIPVTGTDAYTLIYGNYGNGVSQTLYTAGDLADMGVSSGYIAQLKLNVTSGGNYAKNVKIFLANTSATSVSGTSMLPASAFSQVFANTAYTLTPGENIFTLDSAFYWDGVSNLCIMYMSNQDATSGSTSGTTSGSPVVQIGQVGSVALRYRDSSPFTLSGFASEGSTDAPAGVPAWIIEGCWQAQDCPRPHDLAMVNLDLDNLEATFNWTPANGVIGYNVIVSTSEVTDFDNYFDIIPVPDTVYTATGLEDDSIYYVYVQSDCGSAWITMSFSTRPEVFVGNGTGTSDSYLPFASYWYNGWTESRYEGSAIGRAGVITEIGWDCATTTARQETDLRIYMGTVSNATMSSTTNWTPATDLTLVYQSNNVTIGAQQGWQNFQLQTPYVFNDPSQTLVVAVGSSGSTWSSSIHYYTTTTSGTTSLYVGDDYDPNYAQHPGSTASYDLLNYRPNIRLVFSRQSIEDMCFAPNGFASLGAELDTITNEVEVTLTWRGNEDADGYELVWSTGSDPDAILADGTNFATTTDTFYTVTSLTPGMTYNFWLRTDCGNGNYSDWRMVSDGFFFEYIMAATGTAVLNNACGFMIYDDGGANGQYSNNCNSTLTLNANPGTVMMLSGTIDMEGYSYDNIEIYDGTTASGTNLVGGQTNGQIGPFTSTTGSFTIRYNSDSSVPYDGFALQVSCMSMDCPMAMSASVEAVTSSSALVSYGIVGADSTSDLSDLHAFCVDADGNVAGSFTALDFARGYFTGLDSNTTYTLKVWYDCTDGAADTAFATFTTEALPCAEEDPASTATITVGTGGTTSMYVPGYSNYYNGMSEQIYTAAEIGQGGSISSLSFTMNTVVDPRGTKQIYLGTTSNSTATSFFMPDNLTLVYDGNQPLVQGTNTFVFNQPFAYNGSDNLVVLYMDDVTSYTYGNYASCHSISGMTVYAYRDHPAYTPSLLTSLSGTSASYRMDMTFQMTGCLQLASCAAPMVTVDSTTTNSISVSILPGYQENNWNVYYAPAGDTNWISAGTATTSTFTVTGLQPSTYYDVRVASACDGTEFSTIVTTATECGAIVVTPTSPYTQDFESEAPFCWSQDITAPVAGKEWTMGENYMYNCHGEGDAEFWQQSQSGFTMVGKLITDVFDFTAMPTAARLRYYAVQMEYQTNGQPTHNVLYRTSPDGAWTLIDSINTPLSSMTLQEFELPNSAGAAYYQIAFEAICPYGYGVALDDITIDLMPDCVRPTDLAISIQNGQADLSWNGTGTAYVVSYGLFDDTNATMQTINTTTSTASINLSNLPGGRYIVTVQTDCGANGISDESNPVYFWVACSSPVSVPYSENFDSYTLDPASLNADATYFVAPNNYPRVQIPTCWTFPNQQVSDNLAPAAMPFLDPRYAHPTTCLWINARATGDHYSVLPLMDARIDTLVLTFDYMNSSESIEIGVMTDPTDITTFQGFEVYGPGNGSVEHYFSGDNLTNTATTDYYIAFRTYGSYYTFIDNVVVDYMPECLRVANVQQVAAAETSMTIDWTDLTTNATSWSIAYGAGITGPTDANATTVTVNSHPAVISGLTSATSYTIYVRANCNCNVPWSDALVASTDMCAGATYDTIGTSATTAYQYPVNNYYRYTQSQTIYDAAELDSVAKEIVAIAYQYGHSTASTDKTNVSIYLSHTTKSTFTSTSDFVNVDSNFVLVYHGDLNASLGWNTYLFNVNNFSYNGVDNLLVTVIDSSNDYNSSDYVWNVSSCTGNKTIVGYSDSYAPTFPTLTSYTGSKYTYANRVNTQFIACGAAASCAAPMVASVTNVDHQGATVNWTGQGENYEVALLLQNNVWGAEVPVNGFSYTFTGLQPQTTYQFRVRQDCDTLGYSDWSTGTFTTDSLPCMAPNSLTASNITGSTADLSWTPVSNETQWEVRYAAQGDTASVVAGTASTTLTGLFTNATYTAWVRALCGNGSVESDWSEPVEFTTLQCPLPGNVTVGQVAQTSAVITWTAPEGYSDFTLLYGNDPAEANMTPVAVDNATTYTLDGLTPDMLYFVSVKTRCAEDWESGLTAAIDFTTLNVGIGNVDAAAVSLYPNPATDQVTILGYEGEVQIVDMTGRTVLRTHATTIDLSTLTAGAYFVRMGDTVKKLIVK